MTESILVPLDGSAFGEYAIPAALGLARRLESPLHLVHVHAPPPPTNYFGDLALYDSEWEQQLRDQEQLYLDELTARVRTGGGAIVSRLLEGEVAPTLRQYAADNGVALIVMTTHGRGGLSRAWLGSTADALVRQVHTPVLLLRPQEGDVAPEPAGDLKHVLVTLDGSGVAEQALEPALEVGRLFGARYTLVRVCAPTYVIGRPYSATAVRLDSEDLERKQMQARDYLEGVAAQLRAQGYDVAVKVLVREQAAPAILELAEAESVDMIAMATHGRGGWSRLALGSVTDKVIRATQRPVLLLRPERVERGAAELRDRELEHPIHG